MKTLLLATAIIWGDGIHDDTPGFEAMMCGEWFAAVPGARVELYYDSNGRQYIRLRGSYVLPNGMPRSQINNEVVYPVGMPTYVPACATNKGVS